MSINNLIFLKKGIIIVSDEIRHLQYGSPYRFICVVSLNRGNNSKEELNMQKKSKKSNLLFMTQIALLAAIEIVLAYTPLGYLKVGPLSLSFLAVPVAIGACVSGPAAGAILGGVFGVTSYINAVTGQSLMTAAMFQVNPFTCAITCIATRILMGYLTGLIFKLVQKFDKTNIIRYAVASVSAPLLNTVLFMGCIVLFFYNIEYVQNLVTSLGADNPIMFIILLVGIQGVVEVAVCGVVSTAVSKAVDVFNRHNSAKKK